MFPTTLGNSPISPPSYEVFEHLRHLSEIRNFVEGYAISPSYLSALDQAVEALEIQGTLLEELERCQIALEYMAWGLSPPVAKGRN